jgi:hypothetical protein
LRRHGITMIYKFKSKACGDLILLGPQGDQVMGLIGREPAAKGIIEVAAMPAAIAALEAAVAAEHKPPVDDDEPAADREVSLRQRVWPLVEMLRQAHGAGSPVVWGV